MYTIITSNKFLKDLVLLKKRSKKDFVLLKSLIEVLTNQEYQGLNQKHKPHKLSGKFRGYWECHVKPDLLLIWEQTDTLKLIELVRTGTHSDLF